MPGDPQFQGFAPEPNEAATSSGASGRGAPSAGLQPFEYSGRRQCAYLHIFCYVGCFLSCSQYSDVMAQVCACRGDMTRRHMPTYELHAEQSQMFKDLADQTALSMITPPACCVAAPGYQLLQAMSHEPGYWDPPQPKDGEDVEAEPAAELDPDKDEDEPVTPDEDADEETCEHIKRGAPLSLHVHP